MKLYDTTDLPNPRRVRMFLAEKNIVVPCVHLDPRERTNDEPWFRAKNPIGAVPVLELDDGTCISESMAICGYFEDLHPQPPLMGVDPLDRAVVRMWQRRVEWRLFRFVSQALISLVPETHPLHNVNRSMRNPEWGLVCKDLSARYLATLDRRLADAPYVAGERFSVADITLLCAIDLAANFELRIAAEHERLTDWYARVSSRPSARA